MTVTEPASSAVVLLTFISKFGSDFVSWWCVCIPETQFICAHVVLV